MAKAPEQQSSSPCHGKSERSLCAHMHTCTRVRVRMQACIWYTQCMLLTVSCAQCHKRYAPLHATLCGWRGLPAQGLLGGGLEGCTRLQRLRLGHNRLTHWPAAALAAMPLLHHLDVCANAIQGLHGGGHAAPRLQPSRGCGGGVGNAGPGQQAPAARTPAPGGGGEGRAALGQAPAAQPLLLPPSLQVWTRSAFHLYGACACKVVLVCLCVCVCWHVCAATAAPSLAVSVDTLGFHVFVGHVRARLCVCLCVSWQVCAATAAPSLAVSVDTLGFHVFAGHVRARLCVCV